MIVTLPPKRTTRALALVALSLTLAGVAVVLSKYVFGHDNLLGASRLFDLDGEANIPEWYSSSALLLCALLLAAIALAERALGGRHILHWAMLSAIFLYLSADEAACIHDTVGETFRLKVTGDITGFGGFLYYTWVIPGAAFVLAVAGAYARFLLALAAATRRRFIAAGVVYVGGALGMEMVAARYHLAHGMDNLTYRLMPVAEEALEMAGIVIFIHALTSYLRARGVEVSIRCEVGRGARAAVPLRAPTGVRVKPTRAAGTPDALPAGAAALQLSGSMTASRAQMS